jgi:hypothetical protein
MAEPKEAKLMRPNITTGLIAVSAAAFLALAGAISTAEAGAAADMAAVTAAVTAT